MQETNLGTKLKSEAITSLSFTKFFGPRTLQFISSNNLHFVTSNLREIFLSPIVGRHDAVQVKVLSIIVQLSSME